VIIPLSFSHNNLQLENEKITLVVRFNCFVKREWKYRRRRRRRKIDTLSWPVDFC